MKTKLKAFTLIELIVVIAIFGILMAGLMNFFRPIRGTYVDSTLYEQQRTTQNGIIEYLCENTRYADKLCIYDDGCTAQGINVTDGGSAYEAFCKEFIDDSLYQAADLDDVKYKVHIICINRKAGYDKSGQYVAPLSSLSAEQKKTTYGGRLITNIVDNELETVGGEKHLKQRSIKWKNSFNDIGARQNGSPDAKTTFMALGGGYYGAADYVIYVDKAASSKDGITFGVISQQMDNGNVVKGSHALANSKLTNDEGFITVETVQGNLTKNLDAFNYYLAPGSSEPYGTLTPTKSINGYNKNTWIVYTLPDEGDR